MQVLTVAVVMVAAMTESYQMILMMTVMILMMTVMLLMVTELNQMVSAYTSY